MNNLFSHWTYYNGTIILKYEEIQDQLSVNKYYQGHYDFSFKNTPTTS